MTNDLQRLRRSGVALASDSLIAAVFVTLIQMEVWVFGGTGLSGDRLIFASVVGAIAALAIAGRTFKPDVAYAVNGIAVIALIAIGYETDFYQWTNFIVLHAVAARDRGPKAWLALAFSVSGVVCYFEAFPNEGGRLATGFVMVLFVAGWLAGRVQGARTDESALRVERDLHAELAETRAERLALEEQRSRMARELHDIVGHTVNVMVVHAGAGRRSLPGDTDAATRAFQTIEDTGRASLGELDRLLGVLRSDDNGAAMAPVPGLDSLVDMVDQFTTTGLEVSVQITGPTRSVPSSVGLATYRIVQEALTNCLKHAEGSQVNVGVAITSTEVAVQIHDNGHETAEPVAAGRGLTGIAERVAMHGGTLHFGHLSAGGFEVACTLPFSPTPAPTPATAP